MQVSAVATSADRGSIGAAKSKQQVLDRIEMLLASDKGGTGWVNNGAAAGSAC